MKKIGAISLGAVAAIALAWLGASVWVGQRAQTALEELKGGSKSGGSSIRLTQLTHEKGLFSAKGQADLTFDPGCAAEGAGQKASIRINYSMSNLLLPTSVARFEWQIAKLGDTSDASREVVKAISSLTGKGTVSISGAVRTDMTLPEVSAQGSGRTLQITPSKGFLSVNGQALAFGWKFDRWVARGDGQAMEAKDIAIDLDLKNRHLGTGFVRLGAEQVSLSMGSLEGLSLLSEATERGDQIDFSVKPAIRRLKTSGLDLSDLALEMALKGLDTRSVETLSRIYTDSCGMQTLTMQEGQKARDAALKLLTRGLSLGISKVSGKSTDGSISGQLMFTLDPAKNDKPSLASQFKSNGRLEITGKLVPAQQRELAVQMGIAVAKGTGLESAFNYADGLLKVNDRAHDAGTVLAALKSADAQIDALMVQWSRNQDKPAAPQPAAQAQAPAPAPPATNPGGTAAAPTADPALARIDGRWYSDEWKYGYTLRGGVGTATVSNSPNFKPGDQIIFLKSAGETRFVGEQIYKDGKFYTISVSLMPDGRLAFQGDRNVKWIMRRDD